MCSKLKSIIFVKDLNTIKMETTNHKFVCTKNVVIDKNLLILNGDVVEMVGLDDDSIDVVLVETIFYPEMELSIDLKVFADHFELIRN